MLQRPQGHFFGDLGRVSWRGEGRLAILLLIQREVVSVRKNGRSRLAPFDVYVLILVRAFSGRVFLPSLSQLVRLSSLLLVERAVFVLCVQYSGQVV